MTAMEEYIDERYDADTQQRSNEIMVVLRRHFETAIKQTKASISDKVSLPLDFIKKLAAKEY